MKEIDPKNTPLSIASLMNFVDEASRKQLSMIDAINENERYRTLSNWTPEQIAEIQAQGRIPYNFAQALTKIIPVSSEQRQNKTDIKIKPFNDLDDEPKAALATLLCKNVAKASNYHEIENEWFDDGLFVKFGCMEAYVCHKGYYPQVKVRLVDYKDVLWDANSVSYELEDAIFVIKMEKKYRFELEREFGVKISDELPADSRGSGLFEGRAKDPYYIGRVNDAEANPFDIITKFIHYQKVNRDVFCVVFPDTANIYGNDLIIEKFATRKEAEYRLNELNLKYLLSDLPEEGSIENKTEVRIDKYEYIYNRILSFEETDMEDHPFSFYFPIFGKGQFISAMDIQKSPQQFTDRVISQIDYAFGRNLKNVVEGTPEWLADAETPESATKKLSTGGIIWTKPHQGDVFKQIDEKMTNPQYMQMFEIVKAQAEDYGGGRNFQVGAEGQNESGVSVDKKVARGAVLNYIYKDNFRRSKKHLFKIVLWFLKKYDTAERIIPVMGTELSDEMKAMLNQSGVYIPKNEYDGSLRVNQEKNELSFLRNADYELEIVEDSYSESSLDKKLQRGLAAAQFMPEITQTQTWRMNMLLAMGYSTKEAQQTIQEMQQASGQQQQQQAEQMKVQTDQQQQKLNIEKAKVLQQSRNN